MFNFTFRDILRAYRKLITFKSLYNIRLWERCCWLVPKYYNIYNKGQSDEHMSLRLVFIQLYNNCLFKFVYRPVVFKYRLYHEPWSLVLAIDL